MRRTATSAFLAGWTGFLAVSGLTAALAMLKAAAIDTPDVPGLGAAVAQTADLLLARGNGEVLATTVATFMQFMIAGFLCLALYLVHSRHDEDRSIGEALAMTALACIGALVVMMHLGGFGLFDRYGSLLGIETVVVLSIAAVAFDRLIACDDEDAAADDENFHSAATLIGRQMARDAAMRGKRNVENISNWRKERR